MQPDSMNLWKIFVIGGPMMWPLLLCSIFSLTVIIERFSYFKRIAINMPDFLSEISDDLKRQQISEAIQKCDSTGSPIAYIFKAGILKYDRPMSQIKEAMQEAAIYVISQLRKNFFVLRTVIQVSPLLGILGTVMGLLKSFQSMQARTISLYSTISPSDISAGIWESLITTVTGLIIMIASLVLYNYLSNRVNMLILEMEKASSELLNFVNE